MWALARPEPRVCELIPAQEDRPPVVVTFNPQPSPLSLRAARRAVADILRDGGPDAEERAGDAFSAELIGRNIISWSGIGDADGQPVDPTPEMVAAFLAEPRLFEAADRQFVLAFAVRDAEKNGLPVSVSGTTGAETQADDIVSSPATPKHAAAAMPVRTSRKKRRLTAAKPSGSS